MPYGGGNSHPIPSDGATALDESTDCASPTGTLFAQRGSPANPIRPSYWAELRKHWWARTLSNRRPLVCKGTGSSERVFYGVQRVQVSDVSRVPVMTST
jgi:hypothetical protein